MHVLALPKWYPGLPDPQLGDFIRKQMLAVGTLHRVSVIHVCAVPGLKEAYREELHTGDGIWELHAYYRPSLAGFTPGRRGTNYRRYHRAVASAVRRFLKERGRPELIHAHILTRPAYVAWLLARRWEVPFMISEQSSVHLDGRWKRKTPPAKYFDRFLMGKAARTTAVSPHLASALETAGLGHRHAIVPNVVSHLDKPLPPPGAANHFLVVADLVDGTKNISGVLHALAMVGQQGFDAVLEVIGGGPDADMLKALAAELGIAARVVWHGRLPHEEVFPIMARAGTVVVNSNYETFSVVTGEGLATGKPVIATRCGGPEAFIEGANGILIPVGDNEALARAMLQMGREHAQYAPAAVRESVSKRFSPQAIAADLDRIYREATQVHR